MVECPVTLGQLHHTLQGSGNMWKRVWKECKSQKMVTCTAKGHLPDDIIIAPLELTPVVVICIRPLQIGPINISSWIGEGPMRLYPSLRDNGQLMVAGGKAVTFFWDTATDKLLMLQ